MIRFHPRPASALPSALPLLLLLVLLAVGSADCTCSAQAPPEPDAPPSPGPCDATTLENALPVGEAFRAATGAAHYRYRAPLDERELEVTLLDDAGAELHTMRVSQLDDGTMLGVVDEVSLYTRSRVLGAGRHTVDGALLLGDKTLWLEATLEDRRCAPAWAPQVLSCAPGVGFDVEEGLILPGCGLDYDARLEAGEVPTLTRLSYGVEPRDVGDDARPTFPPPRSFDAVVDGEPVPVEERIAWLEAAGVRSALRDDAARRLLAAFADPSWQRLLVEHVAHCLQSGAFDEALTLAEPAQARQGLTSGSNGNRDKKGYRSAASDRGARAAGDPHIETLDGRLYDFQARGEFVLARSPATAGGGVAGHAEQVPLEIQARMGPRSGARTHPLCESVSFTTAVALRVGNDVLEFQPAGSILVNGERLPAGQRPLLEHARRFEHTGSGTLLTLEDGTQVTVATNASAVHLHMGEGRAGTFAGLFGDGDGSPDNDLLAADGTPLPTPVAFERLYGEVRPRWSVDDQTSLFTYAPGESHADYDDPSFPRALADPAEIPVDEREALELRCRGAGVQGAALTDCVLDLFCTDDLRLADDVRGPTVELQDRPGGFTLIGDILEGGYRALFDPHHPADPDACTFAQPGVALLYGERRVTLDADLPVDWRLADGVDFGAGPVSSGTGSSGTGSSGTGSSGTVSAGTVPAGTTLRAYSLVIPPGTGDDPEGVEGLVRFAGAIVGLQHASTTLAAGDFLLPEGVVADAGAAVDFVALDGVAIDPDGRTLRLSTTQNATRGVRMRILVQAADAGGTP